MVFSISPSVIIKEVDLTTTIPAINTPPAAIAGVFKWGPTDERILISSENELASVFGKPTDFNAETFFVAADFLSYSNALYVTRVTSDSANTASSEYFNAKYAGDLGNSIEVSYVTTANTGSTTNFERTIFDSQQVIDSTITFNSNSVTIVTFEDVEDLSNNDILSIGNSSLGFQDIPVDVIVKSVEVNANTAIETFTYEITLANRYTLPETDVDNLTFKRKWGYSGIVSAAPSTSSMHIVVVDKLGDITGIPGQILEKFENVSTVSGAKLPNGTNNYYKDVIELSSKYIVASSSTIANSQVLSDYDVLSGGLDGDSESTIALGKIAGGYDLYKEGNDVDISAILQGKAVSTNTANYIVSNIAEYRKDCVAYLSPRREDVVGVSNVQTQLDNVLSYRNAIQNSSYWVMDSGYKYRYDKYNDVYRWVPLNGDIAGLAARVEPWESPAGYRKGLIRNVIKLAFNPNKTQRDQLYGKDINPVISQVGQGTILFGDKTGLGTNSGSAFTRINVRRLFITVEKAIATISAQFLFEFNDEFTQNQFRQVVEPFLRDIQGRRGIIDFRVVSDATVNTPDIIDQNTFRANIFIKPARSINQIELTFIATRTGVQFEEIVGRQF